MKTTLAILAAITALGGAHRDPGRLRSRLDWDERHATGMADISDPMTGGTNMLASDDDDKGEMSAR